MRTIIFFLFVLLNVCASADAQEATFINSGKITFERRINTFATMQIFLKETGSMPEDQLTTFMQQYRSTSPQFWTDSFDLYFDQAHSFYQPVNPDIDFFKTFPVPVAYKNKVYNNFETDTATSEKQSFESTFFIRDTIRQLQWKLTEETRDIAGYACHRANALLFDSIYIVAFYTDDILTRSGPESFNGLPGMILGIAIPHLHMTYFAQRVSTTATEPGKWKVPVQGRNTPVDNREFNATTKKMLKRFNLTSAWVQFFMDL